MSLRCYHKGLAAALFVCALAFGAGHRAYAQDPNGLGVQVQPTTVEERVDPGGTIDGSITVTNQSDVQQTYYLGSRNVESMDEAGQPKFADQPSTDPSEAAYWITTDESSITLDAGKNTQVGYHIAVPANASPGSHAAAIFVMRQADKATETGAGVGFNVASLVLIRVNGDAVEDVNVREFTADHKFYGAPNVTFTTKVENTGNVHERPRGFIEITDMLGHQVAKLVVNDGGGGVIPHTDRLFTNSWTADHFTLGRYTALATIAYGEDTKTTAPPREVSFWVIPLREVGIVLGVLVAFAFVLALTMRAYVRRALRRAGHAGSAAVVRASEMSLGQRMLKTMLWLSFLLIVVLIGIVVFFS